LNRKIHGETLKLVIAIFFVEFYIFPVYI